MQSLEPSIRRSRVAVWAPWLSLLLAAALFRVWSVLSLAADPRVSDPILDGRYYLELAGRLSEGKGWPPGPLFMTPLYPWLLGWLFRVAPPLPVTVHLFQSLLGLGSLALLIVAARRDLGRTAALMLGGLYVLCGPVLGIESQTLTEALLLFLTSAALAFWPGGGERTFKALLFGLVCGLLTMGRGVFVLLLPAAILENAWRARREDRGDGVRERRGVRDEGGRANHRGSSGRRRKPGAGNRWVAPALMLAGTLLALLPLTVAQTRATHRLTPLTLNGGMNFYIGNNPTARGIYSAPPEINLETDFTAAKSASILAGRDLTLAESSRFWTRRALDFLRSRPDRALWLLGRKGLLYFSPHEVPQIEDFQILREEHAPLRAAWIDFAWILPLAVLGLAAALFARFRDRAGARGRELRLAPWVIVVALGWASTVLFFFTGRYRIPFLPGFLGLAAVGCAAGIDLLKESFRRRRPRPLLAVIPLVVIAQAFLPGYPVEKARAYDAYQQAQRLQKSGRTEEALEEYRQATLRWPQDFAAWHGLGVALVKLDRLPEAAEAYRRALALMPTSAVTHYNLGVVCGRMGQDALALQELRQAIRLDPYDPRIRSDLAIALIRNGEREQAVRELREVLRRDPGYAPARAVLRSLGQEP